MTIRLLSEAAGGSAYLYHSSPSLGEHFFIARVRRNARATFLYCHLCDAVTTIPRAETNADHRELQALIDAGTIAPRAHADGVPLDPLVAGREDLPLATAKARPLIPARVPVDTAGRRALIEQLRTAHVDVRPPGRSQRWIDARRFDVVEHDGQGRVAVVESWTVNGSGSPVRKG